MILRLPFLIKLEFKLENGSSWRKTSQGKGKNQQQTQSHMASTPGFEPGQRKWKSECSYHCINLATTLADQRSSTGAVVSLGDILLTPCAQKHAPVHPDLGNFYHSIQTPLTTWSILITTSTNSGLLLRRSPFPSGVLKVLPKTILSSPSRTLSPCSKKVSNGSWD